MTSSSFPEPGGTGFELDGRRLWLPPVPVSEWLQAAVKPSPGCWWSLLPGWLDTTNREWLSRRLMAPDDRLDIDTVEEIAVSVLSRPVGCDFWAARRLLAGVADGWMQFDGLTVQWGFDPLDAPVHRVVNAMYTLQVQACDDESARAKLDADIFAAPSEPRASGRPWSSVGEVSDARRQQEARAWSAWRGGG